MNLFSQLICQVDGVEFVPHRYQGAHGFFYKTDVLTLDWDIDTNEHPEECVTVSCLEDVLKILNKDVELHPAHVWEVQETRSGYHAVLLGDCMVNLADIPDYMLSLSCDPMYVENLDCRLEAPFDWRLSPKSSSDPVAKPITRVGTGSVLPEVEELLVWYYQAVQAAICSYEEGAIFWEPAIFAPHEEEAETINTHLERIGAFDWSAPRLEVNPASGERRVSCLVQWDRDDDNSHRYTLVVNCLDSDPAEDILAILPRGWEDS